MGIQNIFRVCMDFILRRTWFKVLKIDVKLEASKGWTGKYIYFKFEFAF